MRGAINTGNRGGMAAVFVALAAVACGSEATVPTDWVAGTGGGGGEMPVLPPDPGPAGVAPPSSPGAGAPIASGPGATFAVRRFYLGDTDIGGSPDGSAWRDFGYDIDARISDESSTDHCIPFGDASSSSVFPDGNLGRDNAYGKSLLPLIQSVTPVVAPRLNGLITEGRFTLLFTLPNLGPEPDQREVAAELSFAADRGGSPSFDGEDAWPFAASWTFSSSYVRDRVWVGKVDSVRIPIARIGNRPLTVPLHEAVFTIGLDAAPDVAEGTIAGLVATVDVTEAVARLARTDDPTQCAPGSLSTLLAQVRETADILDDGTQGSVRVCNAVSVGMRFDAVLARRSAPVVEPEPQVPCGAE